MPPVNFQGGGGGGELILGNAFSPCRGGEGASSNILYLLSQINFESESLRIGMNSLYIMLD